MVAWWDEVEWEICEWKYKQYKSYMVVDGQSIDGSLGELKPEIGFA